MPEYASAITSDVQPYLPVIQNALQVAQDIEGFADFQDNEVANHIMPDPSPLTIEEVETFLEKKMFLMTLNSHKKQL